MNPIRPFTLLGVPPRAIRLAGKPSSFALSRQANVAATNITQTESVVTVNNDSQLCMLNGDWSIKWPALVAQRQQALIVAAEGGAFRVDVGEGAHFICDQRKLIGTLGTVQSRLVYNESRLDILWAWTKLFWRHTSAMVGSTYNFSKRWLSKIPISGQLKSIELPRLPKIPISMKHYVDRGIHVSRKLWNKAAERSFEYTHPPKLQIKGPCSILIKP